MSRLIMAVVMSACFTLSAQMKNEPDDLGVGKYKMLLDKYEDDFELDADRAPNVVKLKKEIEHLSRPLKLRDKITISYDNGRGSYAPESGVLTKVTPGTVEIGVRVCKKRFIDPLDWQWLDGLNDPEKLKASIEAKKADIDRQKELFVKTRTAQKLIDLGYTKRFLTDSIILGPNFVSKRNVGHGTMFLQAIVYSGAEHMSEFVEMELSFKGSEELAGVLVVEYPEGSGNEVYLCNFGVRKPSGKVGGKKFKRMKVFFEKGALEKKLGPNWPRALKNCRLVMMKYLHGMLDLEVSQARSEKGHANIPCSDCWGAGEVPAIGGVDISGYAMETLERARAKEAIRQKGYQIIGKYKNPKDLEPTKCPTCGGRGDADRKGRVRGVRMSFKLKNDSVRAYTPAEYTKFEKLYKSVKPFGDVEAIKKKYREQHIGERVEAVKDVAHKEIDDLVAEFTKKYMKRSYELLENRFRKGWFTRREILAQKTDSSPGAGPVLLQGEPDGFAPESLFGHKVRRFSEWMLLRDFKRIDKLAEGYKLNPVFYRVVEVGGADIDAVNQPVEGTPEATKGDSGRDPGFDDSRALPPPPRRGGRRRGDPMFDEMGPDDMEPPEEGTGEATPPEVPEDEVPDDIKDRIYVIQYAAFFNSDTKSFSVLTNMTVKFTPDINPKEEINFDLPAKDKTTTLAHRFKVVAGWRGWLIGSKIITFDQLLSMFDYKSIKFKAEIK